MHADQVESSSDSVPMLKAALKAVPDPVVWTDEDGSIRGWNLAFEHLVQPCYSPILGAQLRDLLPLQQAGQWLAAADYPDHRMRRGEYQPAQYELVQGDAQRPAYGHRRHIFEILAQPVTGVEGNSPVVLVLRRLGQPCAPFPEGEQSLLQLALDAGQMGIWDWNVQTNEIHWTPTLEVIYGVTPDRSQRTLDDFLQVIDPRDLGWVQEGIARAVESGTDYNVEFRVRWPDGSLRWVAARGRMFRDAEGQAQRLVGVVMDITEAKRVEDERKQAEAALRRSNALLKAQQEAAIDGILVVDEHQRIVFYNQRFCQLWRIPETVMAMDQDQELLGWVLDQLEQPQLFLARIAHLYEYPEETSRDEIALKDGRTFDRYSAAVRSPSGEYYGRVWYFRDISESKQAEAALRRSELKYRNLFENSQIGIFRSRLEDGLILDANQRFIEMSGYPSAAAVIEQCSTPDFYPHPDDRQAVMAELQRHGKLNNLEMQYRRRDGSLHWGLFSLYVNTEENCIDCVVTDISEAKRAEEALRASEAQYRDLVETANSIILRWDTEGNIRFLNEYGQRFFGFEAAEIWGQNVVGTIVPETETSGRDLQALMADIQRHPENYLLNENENLCKDGRRAWIVWANKPILDDQGNLVEILSVGTDASQRKQVEDALRRSEQKYRNIFENSQVGIGRTRLQDGLFVNANQRCAEILGYSSAAELVGQRCSTDFYANDRDRQRMMAELRRTGVVHNFEAQLQREDGTSRWALLSLRLNAEEAEIDFVIADISEAKRREKVLHLLSQISRRFIDQDADTAIAFTLEEIAQLSRADRSCIFEYSEDRSWCSLVHEWCGPGIAPLAEFGRGSAFETFLQLNNRICSGQAVQVASLAELPLDAPERRLFESNGIQSVLAVPMTHRGRVVGFIGMDAVHQGRSWSQEDINLLKLAGELIAMGRDRHRAEEALREAKEAAEAANRAKSTFLATMSHELRTPLNAILGFTQLMERDTGLVPRQREFLATINRSGEHLLDLINDVLEMSKIEAGQIVLHPSTFDLHHCLQTLQEMFHIRAQGKGLSLQFDMGSEVPHYVLADEGKLRQVLINLLGNAVKFTDQGGVILRLRAQLAVEPNQQTRLMFEVQDTGRGIPPEETQHLFQPFVQASRGAQVQEGTGLGLAISRQFVQLMGGEIGFASQVGQGSCFRFEIPVHPVESPTENSEPASRRPVIGLAPGQLPYRILVVDDKPDNQASLIQLLQAVGFETRAAENGQEAIAQWQQWQPHLIWMDMRMPVLDGYEATRRIRALEQAHPSDASTIILALTASAFEEQRRAILSAGCNDWVSKPFREAVIFEKMATYLGVQYLYAEPLLASTSQPYSCPQARSLVAEHLEGMAADWIAALHQAALEVDADQLYQLIHQIPAAERSLTDGLTQLVNHYCFDEILDLTQGCHHGE